MVDSTGWENRRVKQARNRQTEHTKSMQLFAPDQNLVRRSLANPHDIAPQDALVLQRLIGNQAVSRMLAGHAPSATPAQKPTVQRALKVGPADDPFEKEANRMAGQVAATGSHKPATGDFQPKIGLEGGAVDKTLARQLDAATQGGSPLPVQIRRKAEPALGADLSHVRVHDHAKSHHVNQELGARAATHGNHILLGRGQSAYDTRLMTHELTHVVQQTQAGAPQGVVQRDVMTVDEWKTISTVSGKNGKALSRSGKLKAIDKALDAWHTNKGDPKKKVAAASKLKEKILAWQYSKTDKKSGEVVSQRKAEVESLLDEIDKEIGAMPVSERLQANYGIKLDNEAGKKAIQHDYKDARKDVREGLETKDWTNDELTGLEGALSNYKGMLGPSRRAKGIKGQPVTTFSRLKQGIDEDDNTGEYELDNTTAGETFTKNISMFDEGMKIKDFASNKSAPTPEEYRKGWQGTIEHELSHALVEKQAIGKWVKQMKFWSSRYRAAYDSRAEALTDGVEPPPTEYGASNANEDLAESMMFYFQDPTTLSTNYPKRYKFIKDNVAPLLQ